jgi:hypothetical protein
MRSLLVVLDAGGMAEDKTLHAAGQVTTRHDGRELTQLTRRTSLWLFLMADMVIEDSTKLRRALTRFAHLTKSGLNFQRGVS